MQPQVQRNGQVEHGADDVADDHVQPAVEPVREGPGQRAEHQRGEQRGQPEAAESGVLLYEPVVFRQFAGQRQQRQQAQPVPETG